MLILGIASQVGAAAALGDYDSIATVTVGSGGAANVEFTSIPSTYQHLQVRTMALTTSSLTSIAFQFNNSTSTLYAVHQIYGDGAASIGSNGGGSEIRGNISITAGTTTGPAPIVVDFLDYANTSKFKTVRSLGGWDDNGSGWVNLKSSLWRSTNAVTSIKFFPVSGDFRQYTHFALYGIKG